MSAPGPNPATLLRRMATTITACADAAATATPPLEVLDELAELLRMGAMLWTAFAERERLAQQYESALFDWWEHTW